MFTKKRIVSLMLVAVMSMSMILTSCTSTGSNYPGTTTPGSVTIDLGSEPPDMCTITTTDVTAMNVLRHLTIGLTTLDKEDKPIAGVAKDWTISDDQLVYTFNLKKDFTWSNGEKVTAHDFKYAFTALVDPANVAEYGYFGWNLKNGRTINEGKAPVADLGVKVIDDYKIEITLERPTPYFLSLLAFVVFQPMNEKAHKEFGDSYATDANKIVTNGPFTMESWVHEDNIVLVKNPTYPMAKDIKLDRIEMKMFKDSNTRLNSFKSNELDMIGLNGDQAIQLKAEDQLVIPYDDGSCWYFEFNLNSPILKNVKMRQALTYAVDSEAFIKNIVKNNSTASQQFTPPAILDDKGKSFAKRVGAQFKSNDIEKAKQLFAEAVAEDNLDLANAKIRYLCDDTDNAQKYAAFFQEQWKKNLGFEVTIEAIPFKARLEKMTNKDFDIVMAGWSPDYNDPMTFLDMFETGNGNNHTNYSSAEYDKLLAKARDEVDSTKRMDILIETEKLLMKDLPIGPIYNRAKDYTLSAKLQGVVRTAFQDINLNWASIK